MGGTGEPDGEDRVTSGFFGEELFVRLFVDPPFEVFVLERSFDDFPPIVCATNAMRPTQLQLLLCATKRAAVAPRSRRFLSEYWGAFYL